MGGVETPKTASLEKHFRNDPGGQSFRSFDNYKIHSEIQYHKTVIK